MEYNYYMCHNQTREFEYMKQVEVTKVAQKATARK